MMQLQTALGFIYPAQCLSCGSFVEKASALCGACWRDTYFITGLVCDGCGVPLPGEDDGSRELCDDCISAARPWRRGRAALLYKGTGRKMVLSLKHGDRTELARPAGHWMAQACPKTDPDTLIVPVPLHWLRFIRRRYNQAGLLAQHLADQLRLEIHQDALRRHRVTEGLNGKTKDQRLAILQDSIIAHPKHGAILKGRSVLLVDDVLTSGATLAACSEACRQAGADHVDVLTLARVAKDA